MAGTKVEMKATALSEGQMRTLEAIRDHIRREGEAPSRLEIARAIGVKHQRSVDLHLQGLERKGWITLKAGTHRGITVVRDEFNIHGAVPVVATGTPMLAEDGQPEPEMAQVQTLLGAFDGRPDYFLTARGDSMDQIGITDGDMVAVRRSPVADEGDLVIARIGSDITMKRYHRGTDSIELHPESTNPEHQPIRLDDEPDCEIVGIVVGAIVGPGWKAN